MTDVFFFSFCGIYFISICTVLYVLRKEPLYDPRILFTLSASLWLLIIHGYVTEFDGYLAAKPGFYLRDIKVLCTIAIGLWVLGYLSFVSGVSLGVRLPAETSQPNFRDQRVLAYVCMFFILIAILNFLANVILISGGNLLQYLLEFSSRREQAENNLGVSAVGYLFGFIGVQVLTYMAGQRRPNNLLMTALFAAIFVMFVVRFSQARVFQTIVLIGACYVSYAMGVATRRKFHVPWFKHIHLLVLTATFGLGIYFLRLASSMRQIGIDVNLETVFTFRDQLLHFALERGNVPNFPVVMTIIDKIPGENPFFLGKTLFNWALFFVPKSILSADYLISLRVKEMWYLDIEGGGLPPTAIGEWYANFGFVGVIAGMFLVGMLAGRFYRLATVSRNPFLPVLWANLVFGFVVIYPKTDLAQIPVYTIVIILFMWLFMKLLRGATKIPVMRPNVIDAPGLPS